ncbi:hypothetical protein BS47DRAFT_1343207 [Hydnum rufescens UP504]|uniref:Glucose receptor Git3 N-terminal domain-containing protein n=1 Tax=Hydnum rufescens UP504 TaxID=1448309 RepID=A0A9P6AYB5_9AGAM|nr:hypothetical protein BS47DRAFT_1343207 [Hydnum rufescens UP504]
MFPGMLNRSQVRRLAAAMIVFIFLFITLMVTIPATTIPHYYGDTGAWCWITDTSVEASRLKIGSEYAYFWLAAAVSLVLYGIIVVNWLREATAKRDRRRHREALSMVWYPIAFTAEVFPISLVRLLQFNRKGPRPRHGFVVLAAIIIASSGAVNVLLWLLTGRRFGFSDSPEGDEEEDRRRDSYTMPMISPAERGLHPPAATAGGGLPISHPSFPEDPPTTQRLYVPEPYVWMPPRTPPPP